MRVYRSVLIATCLCLAISLHADENAALYYWQAFATLPTVAPEDVPENLHAMPASPAVVALLHGPALSSWRLLHRASRLDHCDWQLAEDMGPATPMPHLPKARALARLAFVDAAVSLQTGDSERAVDDYLAALRLSRHVAAGGPLASLLVAVSIQDEAVDGMLRNVGALLTSVAAGSLGGSGLAEGMTISRQFLVQLGGVTFTLAFSGLGSYLILKLVDATIGLRVSKEQEIEGLDLALHDERAYNS
jgi:hypothetical protein